MSQRIGTRLFISRLSFFTTQEKLKSLFSPFGAVTEAKLVMDPNTQRPKGFGFVSYESAIEAEKAIKAMNGRIIDGRLIFVEPAAKDVKSHMIKAMAHLNSSLKLLGFVLQSPNL